jgi:Rieske Fe-S protein
MELANRESDKRTLQGSDEPSSAAKGQSRREFCTGACQVLSIAALGGAVAATLESCGGAGLTSANGAPALPIISGIASGTTLSLQVDATSPLASVGSAALVQTARGTYLVARTGTDSFAAFGATCTHQTCTITGYSGQTFVCPCHGSEFNTAGRVVRGPASAPLTSHGTQFSNGTLTVTL